MDTPRSIKTLEEAPTLPVAEDRASVRATCMIKQTTTDSLRQRPSRLHRLADRWLSLDPSVIVKSVLIALGLIVTGLLGTGIEAMITRPIYGHFVILQGRYDASGFSSPTNFTILIVSAILVAPALETLAIIVLPYYLFSKWAGVRPFLVVETTLAVGLHYYLSAASLFNIAIMFFCFGYQYDLWNRLRGWKVALFGVVLTHGVLNALAYPIAVAIDTVKPILSGG
jgi:hypothetical protein